MVTRRRVTTLPERTVSVALNDALGFARATSLTVSVVVDPALRLRRSEPAVREEPSRSLRAVLASTVRVARTTHASGQRTRNLTERLPDTLSVNEGRGAGVGVAVGAAVAAGVGT